MGLFVGTKPIVSLTVLRRLPLLKSVFGLAGADFGLAEILPAHAGGREVSEIGPATLAAELYAGVAWCRYDPDPRAEAASRRLNDLDPYCLGRALRRPCRERLPVVYSDDG